MLKFEPLGTFKGALDEHGMQFAAEIVAPFRNAEQKEPQKGRFLLVQLTPPDEWALGRITRFTPGGMLATAAGEDYHIRMQERRLDVPDDLRERKLKYRIQIKLLGTLHTPCGGEPEYAPSHRRIPHLGAKVVLPPPEILARICKLGRGETDLGDFALGEFVYNGGIKIGGFFRPKNPKLQVTFDINNLIARRTAVFARAGYGKSNLMKHLIAELYRDGAPKNDEENPVGVLIFDADGEYFWPDAKGRPGLCDVPHLQKHIRIFTKRERNDYYGNYKAGGVKLDIREIKPRDVMEIALTSDRQEQQNVLKIKGAGKNWPALVDLIYEKGIGAEDAEIGKLLGYQGAAIKTAAIEIAAARSNLFRTVHPMHDPNSKMVNEVLSALREGEIVVVDISLLSARGGEILAGLLLRKIFSVNQEKFTDPNASALSVIAVIEEAQSVLGGTLAETSPFVEWVKEGRKYGLGAILITQQPGSLAPELLSQTDNWFCFHLLAESDAETLRRFNSHYSPDILAHLVAEPIPGNCYMWSAPKQPFVLPVKVRDFGEQYKGNVDKPGKNTPRENVGKEARRKQEAADKELIGKLIAQIKRTPDKIKEFPEYKLCGIKSGVLYYLIKDILPEGDTRRIDYLKNSLLEKMLDEKIQLKPGEGDKPSDSYFCAPAAAWEKILSQNKTRR